jgi:uncharacterized membrane-anchored protein YitT (DUF2179 family)
MGKIITLAFFKRGVSIVAGASIAALGLEAFLIPNNLSDGGVVGISIISSHIFSLPIGVFLVLFNLPFIYLGYRKLGSVFALSSMAGILMLSVVTQLLHHSFVVTTDPILAAIFGGAIVGVGVGLVIRYAGTLDGTEIIAILVDRKSPFSVGEIIMFMNVFILGSAGFVFGWDNAMYSLLAYFVAFKVIDITVEGLDESKSVWIVSPAYKEIGEAIQTILNRRVTFVNGETQNKLVTDGVILSVITRIEEQKLKSLVREYDPKAFVVISNVHEVMGRNSRPGHLSPER